MASRASGPGVVAACRALLVSLWPSHYCQLAKVGVFRCLNPPLSRLVTPLLSTLSLSLSRSCSRPPAAIDHFVAISGGTIAGRRKGKRWSTMILRDRLRSSVLETLMCSLRHSTNTSERHFDSMSFFSDTQSEMKGESVESWFVDCDLPHYPNKIDSSSLLHCHLLSIQCSVSPRKHG